MKTYTSTAAIIAGKHILKKNGDKSSSIGEKS